MMWETRAAQSNSQTHTLGATPVSCGAETYSTVHTGYGCDGMDESHRGCAANKPAATVWCCHGDMNQNLRGMFLKPRAKWGMSNVWIIKSNSALLVCCSSPFANSSQNICFMATCDGCHVCVFLTHLLRISVGSSPCGHAAVLLKFSSPGIVLSIVTHVVG